MSFFASKYARLGMSAASLLVVPLLFAKKSFFTVDAGHAGLKFNKIFGLKNSVYKEGWHLLIPFVEFPVLYETRTNSRSVSCQTGSKDLQTVKITIKVLFRPMKESLAVLHRSIGPEYAERVLPSLINEVLQTTVAQFDAYQLINQRETISNALQKTLQERSQEFHIYIDNVSIVNLNFSEEYRHAVEAKQIAQQTAARARYIVDQAEQEKKSIIIKAEAEAESARQIGLAVRNNSAFIELKRIDAARDIADVLSHSRNKIVLQSDTLLLDIRDQITPDLTKTQDANRIVTQHHK